MSYFEVATSSASDNWPTPQKTFDELAREFGPFDLDVCASNENAKCARYVTVAENGLVRPWEGRCWMNPPYGRTIGLWMAKARQEAAAGAVVVCLVPARIGSRWWRESVEAASIVRELPGRLRFGAGRHAAPFPSAVFVFGRLVGRHGAWARQCVVCGEHWFPARSDAKTCSNACRQILKRTQIKRATRDKTRRRKAAA